MRFASKLFLDAIDVTRKTIYSIMFLVDSRANQSDFTRKSKLSFTDMIMFMLNMNKRSMQLELDHFFKNIEGKDMVFTKQAFSEKRLRVSPRAFIHLNDVIIQRIYRDNDHKTYRGYRLLAIDGSTSQLQNTEELRSSFGYARNGAENIARARTSGLFDIENKIIIDALIGHYDLGEREYAMLHLSKLKKNGYKNDLILFDRGYPSKDLIHYLYEEDLAFTMRVSSSFLKEINTAKGKDTIVNIKHKKKNMPLRVVKLNLESGEEEILITNLISGLFNLEDLKELYFKRWGIETKYHELKNVLEIENYTGVKPIVIQQDFHATIYLSNMASLAANAANENIAADNSNKELKYEYKANMNILIGKLKDNLVLMMLQWNPYKRVAMFKRIMEEISRNTVPIKPGRNNNRRKRFKRDKYPMNQRRAL